LAYGIGQGQQRNIVSNILYQIYYIKYIISTILYQIYYIKYIISYRLYHIYYINYIISNILNSNQANINLEFCCFFSNVTSEKTTLISVKVIIR